MQHGARSRGIDSVPTESTGTGTPQNQALRCGIVPSFPPSTLESKQCLLAEGGGAGVEERGAGLADGHTRWSGNLNRYQIKSPDPLFSPLGHEAVHVEKQEYSSQRIRRSGTTPSPMLRLSSQRMRTLGTFSCLPQPRPRPWSGSGSETAPTPRSSSGFNPFSLTCSHTFSKARSS
mgnify:CR=1 FL=1